MILGKGPSFGLRDRYDLTGYELLSLNHAVREQAVLAAHMIDLDVVLACEEAIERQARVLIMPWYPHVHNRAGKRTLAELVAAAPVLHRLAEAGRLLWYDLSTSPVRHGPGPVVRATHFSAEAALDLLAAAGVQRIRTLGVDGGTSYSAKFDDLRGRTLLANGQPSFDLQFQGFASTIVATGVDFAPLDLAHPARVFIAHAPAERLPAEVLAHSIHRRTSLSVAVATASAGQAIAPVAGAITLTPRTHCLADLRPLWTGGEISVPPPVQPADREHLAGGARLVAYAPDGSEPWLSCAHPLGYRWVDDLLDGVQRGSIAEATIAEEIRRGHVRPSLLPQIEREQVEPLLLPRSVRALDRGFHGPDGQGASDRRPKADTSAIFEALWRAARRRARAVRHAWRTATAP